MKTAIVVIAVVAGLVIVQQWGTHMMDKVVHQAYLKGVGDTAFIAAQACMQVVQDLDTCERMGIVASKNFDN